MHDGYLLRKEAIYLIWTTTAVKQRSDEVTNYSEQVVPSREVSHNSSQWLGEQDQLSFAR